MGSLIDGVWHKQPLENKSSDGKFKRKDSQFRNWITPDGSPGPSGEGGFAAESGRYHLYVSLACPWAHRTLIFRKLKNLEEHIDVSIVDYFMGEDGWEFSDREGATSDPIHNAAKMHEVYTAADPQFTGRVTVPVLWDKQGNTIVSNESSEIIRMFNSAFDHLTGSTLDLYPAEYRDKIDAINEPVYNHVNNGVYKSGFATTQAAYEEAFDALFSTLDMLEDLLDSSRYLTGRRITEADWRLFTTLIRFDAVYAFHFKCNHKMIRDYPNLSNYLRELYQHPGIAETVDMDHIKKHYFQSHETINPHRIVPVGPVLNFDEPHDRRRLRAAS